MNIFLTNKQQQELMDIISSMHVTFLADQFGMNILTEQDIEVLKKNKVDMKHFTAGGTIEEIFRLGMLSDVLKDERIKKMTYPQIKKFVKQAHFLPFTDEEEYALEMIRKQTYTDIKGLGNKVAYGIQQDLIEVDRKQRERYEKIIKEETEIAIQNRRSVKQLSIALGKRTQDWARDFDRIAGYNMHLAFDSGKAESIRSRYGSDALVYKETLPGACKHCVRLYLTNGFGSKPVLFTVGELIKNGTNIGRKTEDWKGVVGPVHPYCRCELYMVPRGFGWSNKTKDFTVPIKTGMISRPKVKVTITKKEG